MAVAEVGHSATLSDESGANLTALSGSLSLPAGSTCAIAYLRWRNDVAVTSVTYGGTLMLAVTGRVTFNDGGIAYWNVQAFYLQSPPTGSNTLSVSWGGNVVVNCTASLSGYSGVHATTPIRAGSGASFTGYSDNVTHLASITVASAVDDLSTSIISSAATITTSQTAMVVSGSYGTDRAAGATSVTHTWTTASGGASTALQGFSIQAATGGGGGGPAPASPIVTTGSGANENPLSDGGKWTTGVRTGTGLQRTSNQIRGLTATACDSYYNVATFGDTDFYLTIADPPTDTAITTELYWRLANPGGAVNAYGLRLAASGGVFNQYLLRRYDAGSGTTTATLSGPTLTSGMGIWVHMVGALMVLYTNPGGGAWTPIDAGHTDATYATGYCGLRLDGDPACTHVTNIGIGAASVPPVTHVPVLLGQYRRRRAR